MMNANIIRFFVFLCLVFQTALFAAPKELSSKMNALIENFHGEAGIYVRHLKTGETVAINADTLFPTASMIKVPILIKIFEKIENGELDYATELAWHPDSVNYPCDGGILCSYEPGRTISIDRLISLMITYSDNHASLWLQKMATGEGINKWLEAHGFEGTRMNSRTEGRQGDWEKYGWGQTTPREMAKLLVMIRKGKAVSPAASEEMYRVLTRIYWNDIALSQIPPYVQVASKQGAVDESRSEVVLVNAPHGDYVFCVITKNQADVSWKYENEGFALIRAVSHLLWAHFEPGFGWQPPKESRRYAE